MLQRCRIYNMYVYIYILILYISSLDMCSDLRIKSWAHGGLPYAQTLKSTGDSLPTLYTLLSFVRRSLKMLKRLQLQLYHFPIHASRTHSRISRHSMWYFDHAGHGTNPSCGSWTFFIFSHVQSRTQSRKTWKTYKETNWFSEKLAWLVRLGF